jgi:hypothetical protein
MRKAVGAFAAEERRPLALVGEAVAGVTIGREYDTPEIADRGSYRPYQLHA